MAYNFTLLDEWNKGLTSSPVDDITILLIEQILQPAEMYKTLDFFLV